MSESENATGWMDSDGTFYPCRLYYHLVDLPEAIKRRVVDFDPDDTDDTSIYNQVLDLGCLRMCEHEGVVTFRGRPQAILDLYDKCKSFVDVRLLHPEFESVEKEDG